MRVSAEQIAIIRDRSLSPRVSILLDHVTLELGADAVDPQPSRRLILHALQSARRHLLRDPVALQRYAVLVVRFDHDAHEESFSSWAGPVLDDPWMRDDEKVEMLEQIALQRSQRTP